MRTWYELLLLSLLRKHKRLADLSQEKFEAFCSKNSKNSHLTVLSLAGNVKGLNVQDLSSLNHIPHLQELFIEDAITQDNIEQIASCNNLKVLRIEHAGKLDDIQSIARLTNLKALP